MMPRLHGYETCALIKHNRIFRPTSVIMLSSKDSIFDKARGRTVGSEQYLIKPFTRDDLLGAIKAVCAVGRQLTVLKRGVCAPMGFYAPSQLVQDVRRQGVEVRPVDVRYSAYDCTLEPCCTKGPAIERPIIRLGLRRVKGLSKAGSEALLAARREALFDDIPTMAATARLNKRDIEALAAADALKGLVGHRHRAWWQATGIEKPLPMFKVSRFDEPEALLRKPSEGEDIVADYAQTGLTLRRHPLALLRDRMSARGICQASALLALNPNTAVRVAGLVTCRQRPGTASGVMFVTLEDETGYVNVIAWPNIAEAQRYALLSARLLLVSGTLQRAGEVFHVIARRFKDLSAWIGGLDAYARDFS
jgi:error-prone DNA polymerase